MRVSFDDDDVGKIGGEYRRWVEKRFGFVRVYY